MTEKEKLVHADLVKAREIGKTVEFIATFGSILALQLLFRNFTVSLISGIVAYAIVNGVIEFNLKSIKKR